MISKNDLMFLLDLGSNRISADIDDLYRSKHLAPNDDQNSLWHRSRRERIARYEKIKKEVNK